MATTLTVKNGFPKNSKTEFENVDELQEYLREINDSIDQEIGKLYPLPKDQMTEEVKISIQNSKLKSDSEFIDIASYEGS